MSSLPQCVTNSLVLLCPNRSFCGRKFISLIFFGRSDGMSPKCFQMTLCSSLQLETIFRLQNQNLYFSQFFVRGTNRHRLRFWAIRVLTKHSTSMQKSRSLCSMSHKSVFVSFACSWICRTPGSSPCAYLLNVSINRFIMLSGRSNPIWPKLTTTVPSGFSEANFSKSSGKWNSSEQFSLNKVAKFHRLGIVVKIYDALFSFSRIKNKTRRSKIQCN